MMKVRVHIILTGRVQGVSFRSSTRAEALIRDLSGWIRNLPDGRVESVIEGERDSVKSLLEFCKAGPPGSSVTDIKVEWEKPRGDLKKFEIRF